ncbi:MAG TPA: protein kinase [Actinomycetota bacterium]|jgi:serine/threonine-protein kinase
MEAVGPDRRLAGRYVLEDHIAPGGMATVWRARDEVLARTVAVKVLRDNLAHDPEFAERFQREAINAARLNHPNIISIFDTGVDEEVYFIVMEYFPGRTIRDAMSEHGPYEPAEAVSLVLPVVSALGFAHSNGVVHRDIKPANILVSEDGRVKVADFGIAKAAFAGTDITTTGNVLGTVQYVSPEQVEGQDIDGRSDLYSVGVVLYEMLTGRAPFVADNHVATAMMRLTQDPVPPSALRSGIPRELDTVVMRAMARRPEDRFSSAESMRGALERFTGTGDPTSTRPIPVTTVEQAGPTPRPSRGSTFRSWMLVPLILLLLAAVVVAGGLAVGRLELGGPLGVRVAPTTASTRTAPRAQALRITQAKDFDPLGDNEENSGDAGNAIDADPSSSWTTQHYKSPEFGGLKAGLGLWLDFGTTARVQGLTIRSPIPGWRFELKDSMSESAPSLEAANGETSFEVGSNGLAEVDLGSVQARGILIWITGLGPDQGQFAAAVSAVTVSGASG